jgi:hypothetical protein
MTDPTVHDQYRFLHGVLVHKEKDHCDEGKAILKRVQSHTHQAMLELMRLIALKKRSQK